MSKSKITKVIAISFTIILATSIIWKILNKKTTETNIDLSFVQKVENITPPTFPDNVCNVVDYEAVPNLTKTLETAQYLSSKEQFEKMIKGAKEGEKQNFQAFQKAVEDCSNKGGGTVKIPAGEWKVGGPIHLKSNINLHLEENAVISFSSNPDDFLPVVKTRYAGLELYNYSPMIYALDCENIAITGKGTIRGITEPNNWKPFIKNKKKAEKRLYKMANNNIPLEERIFGTVEDSLRPSMIQPYNCNNILIEGIKIEEGPMWTLHVLYTNNLIIRDLNIETRSTNNDGIVIDSSTNVLIENNNLATGDDAIAIKSGKDRDGWRVGKPSENIVIRNNKVTEAHAGVAIGSEMSGDVRNVLIENLNVEQADRGIRIKSRVGRGGTVENILVQNSIIKNSGRKEPLQINFDYGSKSTQPKTKKKPEIRNVEFRNIEIDSDAENAIEIVGLKNQMSSILFKDIEIKNTNQFVRVDNAEFIKFENITGVFFKMKNSANLEIVNDACPKVEQGKSENIIIDCKK
ncbi:MAG: glycoside hydrolase family 28 protein [Candidatus Moranbacteria bacterium]|nr:glycoside hydrolase family 28 protein [Candidatus Moranbacteria bacterium]